MCLRHPGRLTVEDADHLTDSADAHITVLKEVDYAPQANAGEDAVVYLPNVSPETARSSRGAG